MIRIFEAKKMKEKMRITIRNRGGQVVVGCTCSTGRPQFLIVIRIFKAKKNERKNANHDKELGASRSWSFSRVGEGGQGCILIWSEDRGRYSIHRVGNN